MQKNTIGHYQQICDWLLFAHAHPNEQSVEDLKKSLGEELGVSPDWITRLIRNLKADGRLTETLVIDPLKTRFNHEIRLSLKFDWPKLIKATPRGTKQLPAEWFSQQLMENTRKNPQLNQRLVIIESATIHGSDRRDHELQILTVDGVASIYVLVHTEILTKLDYVNGWYSEIVSYSYRWHGFTGQPVPPYPTT